MKKVLIYLFSLTVIFYIYYWDQLPPRTPYKIARLQSGLNLPITLKISEFKDEWSFNGDGFVLVIFDLNDAQKLKIRKDLRVRKYNKLPVKGDFKGNFLFTEGFISETDVGYFKINEFDRGFSITILNNTKNTLIVFKTIF